MKVRKKKKELSKEAHYKNIIAHQKQEIQKLRKQVGRSNKVEQRLDNYLPDHEVLVEMYEDRVADTNVKCPKCSKGTLEFVDLNIRKLFTCESCGYRKVCK